MQLKELTNQEYNNFVLNFPTKAIYQTKEYAFIMNNQGYDSVFLGLINDGLVIAASLILIKKESGFKYAYAPRGFLINYEDFYLLKEFTIQIKEYLNKVGVIAVKINPLIIKNIYNFEDQTLLSNPKYDLIFEALQHNGYYHLGYNNFFEALKPRFEAIIQIDKDINTLFKNIKKTYRTKIRSAINNGITIYKGTQEELKYLYNFTNKKYPRNLEYFNDCYKYFNNNLDYYYTKLNTNTYLKFIQNKLNYYESKTNELNEEIIKKAQQNPKNLIDKKINMDKYLNKYQNELIEATKLLRKNQTGIITCGCIIVKNNTEVTILIDGDDSNYRRFNSKHLLIWNLIETYQKQGFKTFNLGGLSNMIVDTNKYFGLNEFKLNFGAKMYEYTGDFELICHKRNYNLYRNYVPLKNLIKNKLTK
ncbi:MAG: peptidoglycan bridge formation glycyltransferase FemA/FemB family protein [Bacilli bacterium]